MKIDDLTRDLPSHLERMERARAAVAEPVVWYQYGTLANLLHVDALLEDPYRDLDVLAGHQPVADIGAADGDLAFTLEAAAGWDVDIIDTAHANQNGLRGAALLKARLGSNVQIHDIDLDQQFTLPRDRYGLVFLLGILYHLQNPFYTLRELARRSRFCIISTRVTRLAGGDRIDISALPVGYLVGPRELNDDPTNYWIFTPRGLERLVERAGWEIISSLNLGDTVTSVPDSNDGDERMVALLRSTLTPA